MRKSSTPDIFTVPRRQAKNALIFIVLRTLGRLLSQLWPFLLIVFFSNADYGSLFYIVISLIFSSVVLITSIISYFRFYYFIVNDKLHIEQGVFRRSQSSVSVERIQNVQLEDNLIHRFFSTVSASVTTAGSSESEFVISSIDRDEAQQLREYVMERKKSMKATANEAEVAEKSGFEFRHLFQLTFKQLLKVGLSQNHFRAIGIIMGALAYLLTQAQEVFRQDIFDWAYTIVGWTNQADYLIIFLLVLIVFIIAMMISMVTVIFTYYKLRLGISSDQIRLRQGLIRRKEQTAQLRKIQIFDWSSNPIRRWMNFVTVILQQASSTEEGGQNTLYIPGCSHSCKSSLLQSVFKNITLRPSGLNLHASMIWRYTLFRGAIPALLAVVASYNLFGYYALFFLSWVPVSYVFNHKLYQSWRIEWDKNHIALNRGVWNYSVSIMPWYKIQSIEFKQSRFQHRRDLGNLWLYTAGGNLMIPYLNLDDAYKLQNLILYKAESTKKSWM
ncbi:MAG: PH domain-containing protein [Bacteroidetes bacterium]|jgi:putative membrane protein|nr:PH domain-containing protein [Bacteroidota bacterium]